MPKVAAGGEVEDGRCMVRRGFPAPCVPVDQTSVTLAARAELTSPRFRRIARLLEAEHPHRPGGERQAGVSRRLRRPGRRSASPSWPTPVRSCTRAVRSATETCVPLWNTAGSQTSASVGATLKSPSSPSGLAGWCVGFLIGMTTHRVQEASSAEPSGSSPDRTLRRDRGPPRPCGAPCSPSPAGSCTAADDGTYGFRPGAEAISTALPRILRRC